MQTPAPFEYERATSVEGAIAALKRGGPDTRIIAGGHSLLPMMKLRLASPERLIDINDLQELSYIREEGGEIRIGALTRHVELRAVGAARRALPELPRRRGGHRRPGRAQPRDDRRLALPGRRGRGPLGGLLGGQGEGRDPRRRGRARGRDGRVPHRSVHDGGRRRRDAHRGPRPAAARRRQRPREGGAARGRLGDRRRVGRASGWTATRSPTPASRSARSEPTTVHVSRAEELLRGKTPSDELFEQAGDDRRARTAPRRRTAAGPSTTSATSRACSPNAPCAAPRHARMHQEA